MKLEGNTEIVTGTASGIGREIALTSGCEGARVAIAELNLDAVRAVAAQIESAGGRAIGVAMGVTAQAAVDAGVHKVALFLAAFPTNALSGQSIVVGQGWSMK